MDKDLILAGLRPYSEGDAGKIAGLLALAQAWPPGVPAPTAADLLARWKRSTIQPELDVSVVPGADGDLVAYSQGVLYRDGPSRLSFTVAVNPLHRGQGIGSALLGLLEARANQLGAAYMNAPVYVGDQQDGVDNSRFLEKRGFRLNHCYWQMRLDNIGGYTQVECPQGFSIRRFGARTSDTERWARLITVAFGEFATAAGVVAQLSEPGVSPDGYFFAVDDASGEEVGTSRARIDVQGGKQIGYIGTVGVAPEFRRRGVAEALIRQTLAYLSQRGIESATLFVENANYSARRLYEKMGWYSVYRTDHYWKTMGSLPLPDHRH